MDLSTKAETVMFSLQLSIYFFMFPVKGHKIGNAVIVKEW